MGAYSGHHLTAILFTAGGHREQSLSPSPTPSNLLPPTLSPCSHAGGECILSTCRNGVLASSYCLFVSFFTSWELLSSGVERNGALALSPCLGAKPCSGGLVPNLGKSDSDNKRVSGCAC